MGLAAGRLCRSPSCHGLLKLLLGLLSVHLRLLLLLGLMRLGLLLELQGDSSSLLACAGDGEIIGLAAPFMACCCCC